MTIILEINPAQYGKDRACHPLPNVIKQGLDLGMDHEALADLACGWFVGRMVLQVPHLEPDEEVIEIIIEG